VLIDLSDYWLYLSIDDLFEGPLKKLAEAGYCLFKVELGVEFTLGA